MCFGNVVVQCAMFFCYLRVKEKHPCSSEFAEQDSLADKLLSVWGNLFVMELYELAGWQPDMPKNCLLGRGCCHQFSFEA